MSDNVKSKEDIKNLIKKPNMYRVILLNDDYTTMEFVIQVLMVIFHKSITEATIIMLDVHKKGKGIVGSYTYDIASTKIKQVESMAAESGYPLKSIMEKE
ncbi:MAG: ATP-dependent Clp protease adaptor ClpS [Bacillota bacterium]|nr:ATP-dependent Clp protease adaptor ClpS [Bacillota bacterium]